MLQRWAWGFIKNYMFKCDSESSGWHLVPSVSKHRKEKLTGSEVRPNKKSFQKGIVMYINNTYLYSFLLLFVAHNHNHHNPQPCFHNR
jgi:hypothetical protein